jgi:hypothetical protein
MPDADKLVQIAAWAGVIGAFVLFALFIWAEWFNPNWTAAAAFIVIALFRTTEGPLTLQKPGG